MLFQLKVKYLYDMEGEIKKMIVIFLLDFIIDNY